LGVAVRGVLAQAHDDLEIRSVQRINSAGYTDAVRQKAVDRFTETYLRALNGVQHELRQEGAATKCIGLLGSNGVETGASAIPKLAAEGITPVDAVVAWDGRADVPATKRMINVLNGRVTLINTKWDLWAPPHSVGNHGATRRMVDRQSGARVFYTIAQGGESYGHVSGMTRNGTVRMKKYLGDGEYSDMVATSRGAFIDCLSSEVFGRFRQSVSRPTGSSNLYCSLDPDPACMRRTNRFLASSAMPEADDAMAAFVQGLQCAIGPQQVRVGGVPVNGLTAAQMLLRDYDMKKVSMGLGTFADVPSTLDIARALAEQAGENGSSAGGASMSRFWFRLAAGEPIFEEGDGVLYLASCRVEVGTSPQVRTSAGELADGGTVDENAEAFARAFSNALAAGAHTSPGYSSLLDTYRLLACLQAIRYRQLDRQVGLDFDTLGATYRGPAVEMPEAFPGLANARRFTSETSVPGGKRIHVLIPIVCGGVELNRPLVANSFIPPTQKTAALPPTVVAARPELNALWWAL